jgi:hypothetical protein
MSPSGGHVRFGAILWVTLMHRDPWFIGFIVLLAAVLPWVAAIVWVASRSGWSSVFSQEEGAFPSQASRLRGFGGGPSK